MRYRRVVIKLSGAALSGPEPVGLDAAALEHVADAVLAVADAGVQVAVVVGGGNFFRGSLAELWGIERAEDYPSVQRALELNADALMVAKNGVDGVYTADPRKDPAARRYDRLSFNDAIAKDLRVMDPSAFILARDHDLPLHVFDIAQTGAMTDILNGEAVGTEISNAP
jgi:uridylate kinase